MTKVGVSILLLWLGSFVLAALHHLSHLENILADAIYTSVSSKRQLVSVKLERGCHLTRDWFNLITRNEQNTQLCALYMYANVTNEV